MFFTESDILREILGSVLPKRRITLNSNNAKGHSPRPAGMLSRTLLSLLITAVVGFLYFYVALPPLNFQSSEF